MVSRIIWSQEALDDINAIAAYVRRDSVYHAQRIVEQLFSLTESLASHPELGRTVPELNDKRVRERFLYSYRMLYEIRDNELLILGVIHGKRLLESIEERFK